MNRRSPLVFTAAVIGLAAVVALHVGAPATILSTASAGASIDRPTHKNTAAGGSAPPSGGASSATTGSAGAVPPMLATRRTQVGAAEQYGYGILSVRVTVNGTKIEAISVSRLQTADQYSQQLAQQVIPMLRSQALAAQSAHINGVSGASYTSQAYALSLQSALDKLHIA